MKKPPESKKEILKSNLLYYVLGYSAVFIFGILKVPLLTNVFRPAQLGEYALITSFLTYADIIFLSWTSGTLWRYINEEKYKPFTSLLNAILPAFFLMAATACIFICISMIFFPGLNDRLLLIGFLSVLSNMATMCVYVYLQYKGLIKKWAKYVVAQNLLGFVILWHLVVALQLGVWSIFFSTLLYNVSFLLFICLSNLSRKKTIMMLRKFRVHQSIFSYSFFLIVSNVCFTILNNGDRFIIDWYKGKEALGIYAQTYGLAALGFSSLTQVFSTTFLPLYNRNLSLKQESEENENIVRCYVLVFTPLLFFFICSSIPITNILLGSEFEGHHEIFNWVVSGMYCYGLANFFEIRLKFQNRIKKIIALVSMHALINIILNVIILKSKGLNSAAVVTLVSYLSLTIFLIIFNKDFFQRLRLKTLFIKLLLASFVYLAIVIVIDATELFRNWSMLIVHLLVACFVYVFFLMKELHILRYCIKKIS